MSHNTKQGLIVLAIITAAALVALIIIAAKVGNSMRAEAFHSVKGSLERSYLEADDARPKHTNEPSRIVTTPELQGIFFNKDKHELKFTSYLDPTNIWISSEPVVWGGTNLWCAVTGVGKGYYGINGAGEFREVSADEFRQWPHMQAW